MGAAAQKSSPVAITALRPADRPKDRVGSEDASRHPGKLEEPALSVGVGACRVGGLHTARFHRLGLVGRNQERSVMFLLGKDQPESMRQFRDGPPGQG